MMMSISFFNLLSCPCLCPSVPTRIISTLLFQAYTINWVILLIVLYDGIVLVRINWYTGDSEIAIRDDIAISYQYCMPGATNYVLSNGNSANNNITNTSPSSLSAATTTVTVTYPLVRHKYST